MGYPQQDQTTKEDIKEEGYFSFFTIYVVCFIVYMVLGLGIKNFLWSRFSEK